MNATGDRVAIGAIWNDGNGTDAGHVRIFEWNGSSWVQQGQDIDGEAADDESGCCFYECCWRQSCNWCIYNDGIGSQAQDM